jgi:Fe-S-cluster-containing dehydrogenase component/CRP-like cAMP-binding protein
MSEDLQSIKRSQPWEVPFSSGLPKFAASPVTEADIERLTQIPLFRQIDTSRFPRNCSLRDILLNDGRLRRFKKGDIIVRQGDYGNSAFIVLSGSATVILDKLHDSIIGRHEPIRKSAFSALSQWWQNPRTPEARKLNETRFKPATGQKTEIFTKSDGAVFVQDISAIIKGKRIVDLPEGELFGEIAALSRTQRTTTVIAGADCEMLEIRWQGLREIRAYAPEFKTYVDQLYRVHNLKNHLHETAMFRHLDDKALDRVADATEFLTFGDFEWYAAYSKLRETSGLERVQKEPVVAQQGHYPNGVYLVRSGFARLSEPYNNGERTVSYLGRGQTFGFEEVAMNWMNKTNMPFQRTLRALGYVDVLCVPTSILEQEVLPTLPASELPQFPPGNAARRPIVTGSQATIRDEMMEFIVERRFINGTAAMIIDMDRCTRCDDCVRACAATHDNNPRFLRHGPIEGGFMIANACMHCQDPVCMIGCPTGAIHRTSAQGQVVINDNSCIGCATCANSCPYDNIQIVIARNSDGRPFYDPVTHQPVQKAAKCDLCCTQITGPACANACPHDALVRMDMRDVDNLADWLNQR